MNSFVVCYFAIVVVVLGTAARGGAPSQRGGFPDSSSPTVQRDAQHSGWWPLKLPLRLRNEPYWSYCPKELSDSRTLRATPVISSRSVYAMDAEGVLHCIDLLSGHEQWRYDSGQDAQRSPVLANDSSVFAVSRTRIARLKADSGSLLWNTSVAHGNVIADPLYSEVHDILLVCVDGESKVVAIDGANGHVLWTVGGASTFVTPALSADERGAFLGGSLPPGSILRVDLPSGRIAWNATGGNPITVSSLTVTGDGGVFGFTSGKTALLLDGDSGVTRWNATVESYNFLVGNSPALYRNGTEEFILAISIPGEWVALSAKTGDVVHTALVDPPLSGSVAIGAATAGPLRDTRMVSPTSWNGIALYEVGSGKQLSKFLLQRNGTTRYQWNIQGALSLAADPRNMSRPALVLAQWGSGCVTAVTDTAEPWPRPTAAPTPGHHPGHGLLRWWEILLIVVAVAVTMAVGGLVAGWYGRKQYDANTRYQAMERRGEVQAEELTDSDVEWDVPRRVNR